MYKITNGIELINNIDFILKTKNISRRKMCKDLLLVPATVATWKCKNLLPPVIQIINLAQCHDKLHLMLYDAEENGTSEEVEKIEKAIEETDRVSDEASFTGYLSDKDYCRAKFWVAWRIEMRLQANIEAGNTKYLQYC